MKLLSRAWKWLLVAAVVVTIAWVAASRALGPRVRVVVPERREVVQTVVASGRVLPLARVSVGSVLLGTARRVLVDEGDRARAGQLLVELDGAEAEAAVATARAGVLAATARVSQLRLVGARVAREGLAQTDVNLTQAERELGRVESLASTGAASSRELDAARRAVDLARSQRSSAAVQAAGATGAGGDARVAAAAVAQAEAALRTAEVRLEQTRIVASGDGVVLSRNVEPGDVVQPGRTLLEIALEGAARLVVQPDERNLARLAVGQHAIASAEAFPEERFDARVASIAPGVDALRGTIEVRLVVPRPPAYLRPDMTVSVEIEVGRSANAVSVPASTVRDLGTRRPWVLVVEGDRVVRRDVRVGLRGSVVEIVRGLSTSDRVVPEDAPVGPGQHVRIHTDGP